MKAGTMLNVGFAGLDIKDNLSKVPGIYHSSNPYDDRMNTTITLPKRSEEEKIAIQEIDDIVKSAGLVPKKLGSLATNIGQKINKIDENNSKNIAKAIYDAKHKRYGKSLKNAGKAAVVTIPAVAGMVGAGVGTTKLLNAANKKSDMDSKAEHAVLGAGVTGALALNALAHKRVLMPSKNVANVIGDNAIKYPAKAIKKGSKAGKVIIDTLKKVSKEGKKIVKEQEKEMKEQAEKALNEKRLADQKRRMHDFDLDNMVKNIENSMSKNKIKKPDSRTFAQQMKYMENKYYKDNRGKLLTDEEIRKAWKEKQKPEVESIVREAVKKIGNKKAFDSNELIEKIAKASMPTKKNLAKDIFVDHFLKKGLESIPYYGAPAAVSYMISRDMKNGFKKMDKNDPEKTASFKDVLKKNVLKENTKKALIRGAEVGADGLGRTIIPGALMVATGRNITNGFKPIDTGKDAINSKEQFAKSIVINITGKPTKKNISDEISKHMDEIKKTAETDMSLDIGDILKDVRKIKGEKMVKNKKVHIGNGIKKQFRLDT